ncbi:MAG TPA: rhomboid family intramembrane serine protease [candidate division Zixibacteria bacterium]|nr:rhomboid family intramembrane serine protease [candidate division Zixibacteria bacterium]
MRSERYIEPVQRPPWPVYGGLTPAVRNLLLANGIVFLLQLIIRSDWLVHYFGLTPTLVHQKFYVWQLGTYMFLHSESSFLHILFNMFTLWMFGRDLERDWGSRYFYRFYFICGVGAGLFTLGLTWSSSIATIGASGALFGILAAFGLLYPNRIINLWFVIPVRAKYLVLFFGFLALLASFQHTSDGIGHITHLGGLLVGWVYLKRGRSLKWVTDFGRTLRYKLKERKYYREETEKRALLTSADEVLDRIKEVGGYHKLSRRDKKILEKASQLLGERDDG